MKFLKFISLCLSCFVLLSCSAKEARAIHFGPGPDDEASIQDIECSDEDTVDEDREDA